MSEPLLSVEALHAGYGQSRVLQGVSLSVAPGSITAVLGSNGAGKTTLMRVLSGLLVPSQGRVRFQGQDITGWRADERVAAGLALIPEGRLVFPDFTVMETLRIGAWLPRTRSGWRARAEQMLDLFPTLARRRSSPGGALSGGEQQMLAIARGLMSQPRLLMLDEPSLGLAPGMAAATFAALARIRGSGITILVVDQDVHATLAVADRGYVLENGQVVVAGAAADLQESPLVREAYLGL